MKRNIIKSIWSSTNDQKKGITVRGNVITYSVFDFAQHFRGIKINECIKTVAVNMGDIPDQAISSCCLYYTFEKNSIIDTVRVIKSRNKESKQRARHR